jgi:phosphoserine phosphatase RsbU/P
LSKLNKLMVEDFPSGRFVTLIYAILDPKNRTLKFASAGHLAPLLVEGDHARFLPTEAGTPLGLGITGFSESEVHLPPGSRVVLYSDGITEASAFDYEEYGSERLREHVLNPLASSESILTDVRHYVNGAGLQDDATVIFVRA